MMRNIVRLMLGMAAVAGILVGLESQANAWGNRWVAILRPRRRCEKQECCEPTCCEKQERCEKQDVLRENRAGGNDAARDAAAARNAVIAAAITIVVIVR